ncbi:MAG: HAD hydrolase-like protein [Lachnospiraceae bacterium]|nr:HAD hydrolase-like protein [Lachnospiraceae bacterium]
MPDLFADFKRTKDYLVCIDADGCMMDNMEVKHKECFCPAFVDAFDLQAASRYARECWEYVNLYSRNRGCHRFRAVTKALRLFYARPEVRERELPVIDVSPMEHWVEETETLSHPALEAYINGHPDCHESLRRSLAWSAELEEFVNRIVRGITPFPHVKDVLSKLREKADVVLVSATRHETLLKENEPTGVAELFHFITGQEYGTKAQIIARLLAIGGYDKEKVLKIGDAPGDHEAAQENGVLFYPVIPTEESLSWKHLERNAADAFFAGSYAQELMPQTLDAFYKKLLEDVPWETSAAL